MESFGRQFESLGCLKIRKGAGRNVKIIFRGAMRLHNGAIKLPFPDEWVNFILGKLGRRGGRPTFLRDSFFFSPRDRFIYPNEREAWNRESCESTGKDNKRQWKFEARLQQVSFPPRIHPENTVNGNYDETPDDLIPFYEHYFSLSNERRGEGGGRGGGRKRTRKRIATIKRKKKAKIIDEKSNRVSRNLSGEHKNNNDNNNKKE